MTALGVRSLGLGGLLGLLLASATIASAQPGPSLEPRSELQPPVVVEPSGLEPPVVITDQPMLDDGILPCGLRVILAQDTSLPVAAVVLSIETGTEDDPPSQPGLTQALAYQLQQGNRELTPGGAAEIVQDRGGLSTMAIGPAMVRYESLVPISALNEALWVESQRLRAPSVNEKLWSGALRVARRNSPIPWRIPRPALAAAHGVPGLEHDGHSVSAALEAMVPRAVAQALAERFRYSHATLVVVSAHPPHALRARIEALFADLPPANRTIRDRTPRWRTGQVPQPIELKDQSETRFVWPVAPDPAHVFEATVFCKAINRQQPRPTEPVRGQLRCDLDVDPRRSTLTVRAIDTDDPLALLTMRLERLERHEDDALVEQQRQLVYLDQTQHLHSPRSFARHLAGANPRPDAPPTVGWTTRPVAELTGIAALSQPWTGHTWGPHLHAGAAIELTPTTSTS